MNVIVIYGGESAEHDISIMSAFSIMNNLDRDKYQIQPVYITKEGRWLKPDQEVKFEEKDDLYLIDGQGASEINPGQIQAKDAVVFPALHGPNGEDGTVQGLFESLKMPYVGCGVLASAVSSDKVAAKQIFESAGIPQVPYQHFVRRQWQENPGKYLDLVEAELTYPVFVKPANMGSSVGITRAIDRASLSTAIDVAGQYDRRILVEQGIDAREIEVGVIGYDEDVEISVVGEVGKEAGFYDFDEKYVNNSIEMLVPAPIDQEDSERIRAYAGEVFRAIDGSGLARCDFFLTEDNNIYINEVNTLPGFTPFSMFSVLWETSGLEFSALLDRLIDLAWARFDNQ